MMRRLLVLVLLASLSGCSWISGLFSSDDPRKPVELTPIKSTLDVKPLWNFSVGSGERAFFSPAISGDSVYVAASDGTIARLSAATGAVTWRIKLDEGLGAGVGAENGIIAVANRNGEVIALDTNGKPLWRAATNGEVLSVPAIGNGLVVARTTDGRFLGFDATSGARRWLFSRPSQPLVLRSAPGIALGNGNVYAGLASGKLIALTQSNGALHWEAAVAIPKGATELERVVDVMGTPLLGPRDVCVATFQGRVGCFTLDSGTAVWGRDISTSTGIGMDTRNAYVTDDRSVVQAFSRLGGANLWKNDKLLYRELTAPVPMGNSVVAGDYQGVLHWFSKDDGAFLARVTTDGSPIRIPAVAINSAAHPTIVVQTRAGGVFAFTTE